MRQYRQGMPVSLTVEQFDEFVLPHLTIGKRGPVPKLSQFKSFGYVMELLYMDCGVVEPAATIRVSAHAMRSQQVSGVIFINNGLDCGKTR
jgi:hypothetical protein